MLVKERGRGKRETERGVGEKGCGVGICNGSSKRFKKQTNKKKRLRN